MSYVACPLCRSASVGRLSVMYADVVCVGEEGRDRETPAKGRQQQSGDEPPAVTHSLFLAQECAMKADVVGGASCGLYKMFPAGRFMVLAHDLRFTYWEKKQ